MTTTTVPFSLRIEPNIKQQLEAEAKELDRSISYVAIQAIKDYLQAKSEKTKAIKEAVIQADKGVFVSEESADNYIKSLSKNEEINIPQADVFLPKP